MNYHDDIGSIITNHRKKKNISQSDLAKKLFVTRQAVSNWENNKTRPDISVIFKLCKILDIDIKLLVAMDDNITIEDIIEVEKKKTTKRNLIFSSVIFIILVGIIFTLVIVFNRNKFALYNVYLDSDEFALNNSIIVKSKVQNYFQLGTLVSKLDITNSDTEYNIKLYKKCDDEERLVFEGTYTDNFYLTEKYGYGEYFEDGSTNLDKLYIEISFVVDGKKYVYNYKLRIEEKFKNDSLIYLKNKGSSDVLPEFEDIKISEDILINNGYTYDLNSSCYIKEVDGNYIKFYLKSMLITLKKDFSDETILIDYFMRQDRFRVTNYDKDTMNTITNYFDSQNILETYQNEINYLQNEINILESN